jgi:hypothetical protein
MAMLAIIALASGDKPPDAAMGSGNNTLEVREVGDPYEPPRNFAVNFIIKSIN